MQHPPEWFVTALESLDSLLHVRWGSAVGRWVVERTGHITENEINFLVNRKRRAVNHVAESPDDAKKLAHLTALTEELNSAKAGRRIILYAKVLDQRIFNGLMERDIQRYGGYCRAIIEIESAEIKAQESLDRAQESRNFDLAMQTLDEAEFVSRKKETELHAGRSWKELLKSGRSSGARTGIGSLGEYRVVDKRTVKREVSL